MDGEGSVFFVVFFSRVLLIVIRVDLTALRLLTSLFSLYCTEACDNVDEEDVREGGEENCSGMLSLVGEFDKANN